MYWTLEATFFDLPMSSREKQMIDGNHHSEFTFVSETEHGVSSRKIMSSSNSQLWVGVVEQKGKQQELLGIIK